MRIYDDRVDISYAPGLIIWKTSWEKHPISNYQYYIVNNLNVSLIDKDFNPDQMIVHSKGDENKIELSKIENQLTRIGLKRISITQWLQMRKDHYKNKPLIIKNPISPLLEKFKHR